MAGGAEGHRGAGLFIETWGNDGGGNGQAGHNARRQARDEETRRLS